MNSKHYIKFPPSLSLSLSHILYLHTPLPPSLFSLSSISLVAHNMWTDVTRQTLFLPSLCICLWNLLVAMENGVEHAVQNLSSLSFLSISLSLPAALYLPLSLHPFLYLPLSTSLSIPLSTSLSLPPSLSLLRPPLGSLAVSDVS